MTQLDENETTELKMFSLEFSGGFSDPTKLTFETDSGDKRMSTKLLVEC